MKLLKYYILLLMFTAYCLLPTLLHAQGLINNGASIIITNTGTPATLIVQGNYLSDDPTGSQGEIDIDGNMIIQGNWTNNNTTSYVFKNIEASPGPYGTVFFTGTSNQAIGGSRLTNFENLTINNSIAEPDPAVSLTLSPPASGDGTENVIVNGVLNLVDGALELNRRNLTINNAATAAVQRTEGYIRSIELDRNFYSRFQWNIGTPADGTQYTIPFGVYANPLIADTILIFTYTHTGGNPNEIIISTYRAGGTLATATNVYNNRPYEAPTNYVTNLEGACGDASPPECAADVVKRFWYIQRSPDPATANFRFTYAKCEVPVKGEIDPMKAQRYNEATDVWEPPLEPPPQSFVATDPTFSYVVVNYDVENFSPWVITRGDALLPIELLSFTASCKDGIAQIHWATASEINNDYFTVERSKNLTEWEVLGIVNAAGDNPGIQYYTYISPLVGDWAIRLKQTDLDGNFKYFGPLSVQCTEETIVETEIVGAFCTEYPHCTILTILFNMEGEKDYSIAVYDVCGRLLASTRGRSISGFNATQLTVFNIPPSVYFIVIRNDTEVVTEKILYPVTGNFISH